MENAPEKLVFESDWLASDTMFYHAETGRFSRNMNEVIDYDRFEWDWEGLANYLDWGYCVMERTPIQNVRFMPPRAAVARRGGETLAPRKTFGRRYLGAIGPTDARRRNA